MKTLKKVLCVVLALAMVLGMTVVSSAAFTDANKVTDKEAVEVMNALGVLVGSNGKVDPQGTLTRAAAAKLVAYLMLGNEDAEALPAVQVFSDVPATNWAAKYVAYLAKEGIVAGTGAGKFSPDAAVTGYEFGKMLLVALGYDASIEGMTGSTWMINVAQLMKDNDLADSAKGTEAKALTREQAARYCLNALKATTVKYADKGTKVTINGVEIASGAKDAEVVTSTKDFAAAINDTTVSALTYTVELGEKLYEGDLELWTLEESGLVCGWEYKDKLVGMYFDNNPDYVYTMTEDKTFTGEDAAEDLGFYLNGKLGLKGTAKIDDAHAAFGFMGVMQDPEYALEKNDVLKVYVDDNNDAFVLVERDFLVKVKSVKALTADEIEDLEDATDNATVLAATKKIELDVFGLDETVVVFDSMFNGFNYVKNDYVVVDYDYDYALVYEDIDDVIDDFVPMTIVSSKAATVVEGKVTGTKGSPAQYLVNGTYYKNYSDDAMAIGDTGAWVLDNAGHIAAEVTSSRVTSDYIYIYSVKVAANDDGVGKTVKVNGVTQEGTKVTYTVDTANFGENLTVTDSALAMSTIKNLTAGTYTLAEPSVVAYKLNKDGKIQTAVAKEDFATPAGGNVSKAADERQVGTVDGDAVYADASTKFVFVYVDGTMKTKVVTGVKNVKFNTSDAEAVICDGTDVKYVFVSDENGSYQDIDYKYAVVSDTTKYEAEDDVYYINVLVNGEKVQLTSDETISTTLTKGTVIGYRYDGETLETTTAGIAATTVTAVKDGVVTIEGVGAFEADDIDDVFVIDVVTKKDKDGVKYIDSVSSVTKASFTDLEEDATVYVCVLTDDFVVFVVD